MTEPVPTTPPGKKSDKRKQTIIVIASVVGVLITYLIYRRSSANAATAGTANTTTAATSPTTTDSPAEDSLLGQISTQLSALGSSATSAVSSAATSTPYAGANVPGSATHSTVSRATWNPAITSPGGGANGVTVFTGGNTPSGVVTEDAPVFRLSPLHSNQVIP